MSQPFIGQIQLFAFPFPPRNWALAAGQTMPIRQSTTLFSLLGTNFGGNGTTTFQLPNLASTQACGTGTGAGGLTPRVIGEAFGSTGVTLTTDSMPAHNHQMEICTASPAFTVVPAANSCIGTFSGTATSIYVAADAPAAMAPGMVLPNGGGLPHPNIQPYLALNICIALDGAFPRFP